MGDAFLLNKNFRVKKSTLCLPDKVKLRLFNFHPGNPDSGSEPDPDTDIIVFIAGWVSLIDGWKDVLTALAPKYRILYVETREKRSAELPDNKPIDMSIEQMSRDLDVLVREMIPQGQPFYFAGSSMGATVILDYLAAKRRPSVNAFLISPICEFPFPAWIRFIIKFFPALLYPVVKPLFKAYLSHVKLDRKKEPAQVEKYCGTIDAAEPVRLKANASAIQNYTLWDKLPDVTSQVLLIGAETDTLHGIDTLKKMAALMPLPNFELMKSNKETHSKKIGEFIDQWISFQKSKKMT